MKIRPRFLLVAVCLATIFVSSLFAQNTRNNAPRQTNSTQKAETQNQNTNPAFPDPQSPTEVLANEIVLLRKSLQSLNTRVREINEKLTGADFKKIIEVNEKQRKILSNLEILSRAEQRAEILRKQLIELVEKENSLKIRLGQVEEEIRPENIDRALNVVGGTRTPEMRETRRKASENERSGLRSLISQIEQSRQRLEDDVKQADFLVFRLRQQVLPAIEREVQNFNSN